MYNIFDINECTSFDEDKLNRSRPNAGSSLGFDLQDTNILELCQKIEIKKKNGFDRL